jgi:hypothetical protein
MNAEAGWTVGPWLRKSTIMGFGMLWSMRDGLVVREAALGL